MSGSNKNTGPLDAVAILATMRRERTAAGGAVMNFSGEWVYAVIDHYARRERGLLLTNNVYLERARSAETDLGRVERNRDMWKGQVDRQAEEITRLRAELAKAEALIKEIAAREVAEINKPTPSVALTYTNYRGETAERRIIPFEVWFGSTEWHPEPQWLLRAYDCEKKAERDFALKDFGSRPLVPSANGDAYSHDDRVALASSLSWDVTEITPDDVKGILDRLAAERYRLVRFDVSAVEPAAALRKALTGAAQEFDRISCVPNVTETKDTYDQFQLAKAYADRGAAACWAVLRSPPLSREGEDSAEVERALAFVARWAWREDPSNAVRKLTDAERLSAIKHHPTIKALAATRSGSSAGQTDGEDAACVVCGEHIEEGDPVYWSTNDDGHMHAECAKTYVDDDGNETDTPPEPFPFLPDRYTPTKPKDIPHD